MTVIMNAIDGLVLVRVFWVPSIWSGYFGVHFSSGGGLQIKIPRILQKMHISKFSISRLGYGLKGYESQITYDSYGLNIQYESYRMIQTAKNKISNRGFCFSKI